MEEVWKDIIGFEGLYQFSNLYRVRSLPRATTSGKILKIQMGDNNDKYPHIDLRKNGKQFRRRVHRLVLEYFIGPCPKDTEGCHNDGNLKNYFIENLRWGTKSENRQDSIKHGTRYQADNKGSKNGRAQLNEKQIRIIKWLLKNNSLTIKEIAKIFNVSIHLIYCVRSGKSWSHIK